MLSDAPGCSQMLSGALTNMSSQTLKVEKHCVGKKYFEGVYNISVCDQVTGFTDPELYTPERCGHLLNSTYGTKTAPNCGLVSLGGLALVLVTIREVAAGEELLWNYGPNYWKHHHV